MVQKLKAFLFRNNSTGQTVAKNTIWLSVSNIGGRVLKAILIIYAARILGAAGYGVFSYAVTMAGFLTMFIDMGLNSILTKSIAAGSADTQRKQLLSTAFFMKLVLLALGALLIIYIGPQVTNIPEAVALLPLMAVIFVFDALREFAFSVIRAYEKMEYEAGLFILTNLLIVIFGFIFLAIAPTVRLFALSYVAGTVLGTVATFVVLRGHFRELFSHYNAQLIRPIFALTWPFALAGLMAGLMLNTDILVLGYFQTAANVGYFSAGQRLVALLYVFPSILSASALPIFARLANRDNERLRRILERLVHFSLLASVPLAVGGYIVGTPLTTFLFGSSYAPAVWPFKILMLTMIIDFPAAIIANGIFAYDQQKKLLMYTAIGGVINAVLDFVLIPPFGIIGCAIGTFIAQVVSNAYLWRAMKHLNPFSAWPRLGKVIGATAVMGLVVYGLTALGAHVLITIAVGMSVYAAMLYLLGEPLLAEIKSIFKTA